jgi:hypothetical protein
VIICKTLSEFQRLESTAGMRLPRAFGQLGLTGSFDTINSCLFSNMPKIDPFRLAISSSTLEVWRSDLEAIDAEVAPSGLRVLAHDLEPDRMPASLETPRRQDDPSAGDHPGCVEI